MRISCSPASAALLPMVLEDALKIGFTRNQTLIERFLVQVSQQNIALSYKQWHRIIDGQPGLRVKLSPAGHIPGSAFVEFEVAQGKDRQRIVFSGDLGGPYTALLPAPRSPYRADIVILESTYGDCTHESRKDRRRRLQALCEHAFRNKGSILIPAFSIGRILNYLKAILGDPRHDVLFVGYQARGTPGREIQKYGPKGGYAVLDGQHYPIRAAIHTLGGYSAWCTATPAPSRPWRQP